MSYGPKLKVKPPGAGHPSIEQYLCALLVEDLHRDMDPEMEAELLKGLDSPAEEMTDADWDKMREDFLRQPSCNKRLQAVRS